MSDFALGLIVGSPLGAVVGYSLGVLRAPRSILPPPIPAPSPAPEPSPIPPPPPIQLPAEVDGLPPELQPRRGVRNRRRYEPVERPAQPVRPDPLSPTTVLSVLEPARLGGEGDTGTMPRVGP